MTAESYDTIVIGAGQAGPFLAAKLVSGEQTPEVVREAFHTLRQAVQMKPGGWSEAETAKVVESLMKAVREISEN